MKSLVFSRFCHPTSEPKNIAVPPSWLMPASKLTRVRRLGFSNSNASTRRASQAGRRPDSKTPLTCSEIERIVWSSCWLISNSESKCLTMEFPFYDIGLHSTANLCGVCKAIEYLMMDLTGCSGLRIARTGCMLQNYLGEDLHSLINLVKFNVHGWQQPDDIRLGAVD